MKEKLFGKAELAFNGNEEDIFNKEFYKILKENS